MPDFFYRTEDITPADVIEYFVETQDDRNIVEAFKARNPVIVLGSRGVGKSFLLRVAEAEMLSNVDEAGTLPVYVTFNRSSLILTNDPQQFQHWMLALICTRIVRALKKQGLLLTTPQSLSILTGTPNSASSVNKLRVEEISDSYENSWQSPQESIDVSGLPTVDAFRDAIEDICDSLGVKRIALLIDEAAHIFLPDQQRQFFTLFRDLRSPYLTCNAAVYPGVTAYGPTFQPAHDATMLNLERDVLSNKYVGSMREIVEKQADSTLLRYIAKQDKNFSILAYAASGNPRILLKTISRAPKVSSSEVNEVVREYYRTDVWAEHSALGEKYSGHRLMIDWGRKFIENSVLPELQKKNKEYLDSERNTSCFFWIHRDAPQAVKEALRLLAYTGIVLEHATGIRATRSEVGVRYAVNLGCLFALEPYPASVAFKIASNLTPKRMSEYGANHPDYQELLEQVPNFETLDMSTELDVQLNKSVDVLDMTNWQKSQVKSIGLASIKDLLQASEGQLQQLYYIGPVRSRRMRNSATAAVFEYLSG